MKGLLSRKLEEYGFKCYSSENEELYFRDTGRHTTLFIEGKCEPHEEYGEEFYYDFYKQTTYKGERKVVVYAEHLDCLQMPERVQRYMTNRERYITWQKKMENRREG